MVKVATRQRRYKKGGNAVPFRAPKTKLKYGRRGR